MWKFSRRSPVCSSAWLDPSVATSSENNRSLNFPLTSNLACTVDTAAVCGYIDGAIIIAGITEDARVCLLSQCDGNGGSDVWCEPGEPRAALGRNARRNQRCTQQG